jgi:predicted DNA-binding transcriptional regulator YafY
VGIVGAIDGAIKVLILLRKNKIMSRNELGKEINVDKRMISRYIVALRASGFQIESIKGKFGGYKLKEVYLSDDEYVALCEAKELIKEHKPYLQKDYNSALEKINYKFYDEV